MTYALPGGLTARIRLGRSPAGWPAFVDGKLGFYLSPNVGPDQPVDLEMQLGRFTLAPPAEARVVDKDFLVARDYLAFTGGHGRGATEIRGVETADGLLIRHCPVRERPWEPFRLGVRGMGMVFEPMLKYLYQCRGWRLLHGGAVVHDGRAVLVLGGNGTHKTRVILEMCLRHACDFGGDDLILLRQGRVEPLVENGRVLYERARRLLRGKPMTIPRTGLARLCLAPAPACPDALRIGRAAPVVAVLVLERHGSAALTGPGDPRPMAPPEVSARLVHGERLELCRHQRRHHPLTPFDRFIMAYEYALPGSRLYAAMLGGDGSGDALHVGGAPAYGVKVPAQLTPDALGRLCGLCRELVRKGVP